MKLRRQAQTLDSDLAHGLSILDGAMHTEPFSAYAARILQEWSPIIVTNRPPYVRNENVVLRRAPGGVVTAMLSVAEATGATWIACGSDAEGPSSQVLDSLSVEGLARLPFTIRCAPTAPTDYAKHYGVIANPLLWFIQHYLWSLANEPLIDDGIHEAWHDGYVRVNQSVAEAVAEAAMHYQKRPLVLFQDYHVYLAPRMVRERLPDAMLQHFVHIPWPTPQYWTVLPQEMRDAIRDGLLANDVIGFQTNRDVRNFLSSCEELMGLRVDHREGAVVHRRRVSWVRAYPVSVDIGALQRLSSSGEVAAEDALLTRWRTKKLIVRIDRTDPIKNIVRGFLAYERMLRDHLDLLGAVQFRACLQPSRQDVKVYRDYLARVRSTAARALARWYQPLTAPFENPMAGSVGDAHALLRKIPALKAL